MRLDDRLGLVIDTAQSAGGVAGYFMVKQAGIWQRLTLKTETGSPQSPGG
jgi:hypothetical protein